MIENGYTTANKGETTNDAIRRLNNEGWRVIQVVENGASRPSGFLLERTSPEVDAPTE